jgi:hypothetical protein
MAFRASASTLARSRLPGILVFTALVVLASLALGPAPSAAQEALTNDDVVKLVKGGLPESVIIQKIRSSPRKFDTSADGLIKLKNAGVPDKIIEAMVAPASAPPTAAAPPPASAASSGPAIAHLVGSQRTPLKGVYGNMEFKVHPFGGSRQEVVLLENRAQYRITEQDPVFFSANPDHQWILVRLKPGKRDRNLPMSKNSGMWNYGGHTFRHGVDPKYAIKLVTEPGPNGGVKIKAEEPLKPGEYGFVAATRGQINMNEVFDFAVD